MEYIIIALTLSFILVVIKIIYKINIKKIKQIGENNKELDEIVKKYPSNVDICKAILKKLNNEKVIIQEEKDAENCLYIAITDKIIIANLRESFTRIQTIAHECLHSIQDRSILLFNYIYSNIYLISFYLIIILGIAKIIPQKMLVLCIFTIFSFLYYFVRSYLEIDAMIKARYVAKEYMEEIKISSKEEIERIAKEYDNLNHLGIKTVNYSLFFNVIIRTIIITLIFLIA